MKLTPLLIFLLFFATGADAQVKKERGLFGFGKKSEQISAGLFPDNNAPVQTVQTSAPVTSEPEPTPRRAPAPPRTSDNIFKTGTPQDVESVSYTIEDGQKVEQDSSPKRKSRIFGFGKKEKPAEVADTDAIEPVPAPSYPDPQNSVTEVPTFTPTIVERAPAPPVKRTARPIAPQVQEVEEDVLVTVVEESPAVEKDEEEKKPGFFSLFSRKKNRDEAPAVMDEAPVADVDETAPAYTTPTVAEVTTPAPVPAPAPQSPAPQPTAAAPQPSFPAQSDDSDPIPSIPTFAGSPGSGEPEKEKNGFRLGDPISKLRPTKQDKPLDLTGAETIISDGEIIRETEDIVENNIVSSGDGNREAPRIVNGVKTYSSWEDVEGRSVSAADKILNQIR